MISLSKNAGDIPAEDVAFVITPPIAKLSKAKLLVEGTPTFAPGRVFRYSLGSAHERAASGTSARFEVAVSYLNRQVPTRITDRFSFDISEFLWTALVDSDVTRAAKRLEDVLKNVVSKLARIEDRLETISSVAGGTGLDISFRTLRNLRRLQTGEEGIERMVASGLPASAFREVLGVDWRTALNLQYFATHGDGRLEDLDGLSPEVLQEARAVFIFDDDTVPPLSDE